MRCRPRLLKLVFGGLVIFSKLSNAYAFPTVCSVVKTMSFRSCLGMSITPSMCGFPPRPCAHFSYSVPQSYLEVSGSNETFFKGLPGVEAQLNSNKELAPFPAEGDEGAFSYHGHTINVPFAAWAFNNTMPCGGAMWDRFCFSSMSEHLGRLWKTGEADLWQPAYLAWSAAPKACLIKGALSSATGESRPSGYPNAGACSFDRSWMKRFPPSGAPVCSGWGIHFPRYGTVTSSDQTTASLMIASRIKSLGSEVFQSVPSHAGEKWQMIYPQGSSCFREGQNIGLLRLKRVNEVGRLWSGKVKNFLYTTWKPVGCTRDVPYIATTKAWVEVLQGVCSELD